MSSSDYFALMAAIFLSRAASPGLAFLVGFAFGVVQITILIGKFFTGATA